ncbi:DNA polymerase III subunit epsilon [Psychrobacter urativorans]|uniref:Ribonuclease H n=1 Tax=Psychrobacter urativorans TaxID=45610 RepID=A0A0M4TU07_9GAMM|nr:DNA polymerase III subunit epsilon [Psychrobacter urativorans]ALF59036.1 DNA polymerase III subunit epsilon [Psychrobacter urativorans]
MSDHFIAAPYVTNHNATDPLAAKTDATVAYADGACKGNPGAGGWGAHLIFSNGQTQDLYGGDSETTNNRMELMGAIQALNHSPRELKLEIWTDSSYVKKGITEWIEGWKKRGWKTASKKPVANQDLWQQLDELCQARDVDWYWVKGHAGHAGNEKADELANLGVTSNSGHAIVNNEQSPVATNDNVSENINDSIRKKKVSLMSDKTEILSDDDWLTNDILGFDMLDDDSDEEFSAEPHDTILTELSLIESNHQPNNATPPMSAHIMTADSLIIDHRESDVSVDLPKFDGDTSRANPHFRPLLPKPIHRHEANRQLIMDTETTGLDPLKGDRVIEVGIVEMIGRKFTGEKLHVYINPQRGMDEVVIRIHGISEAFLADKPTFDQVAQPLYEFMDGAEIIAHNASFDMSFLSMEFSKVGITDFAQRVQVTDSLVMAKQQYPGQKNTLDALVRRLNVGKQDRTFHGALLDSEILAEVYLAMTGGQVSLAIEEEGQSDGGQTAHTQFATLAALLVESSTDSSENQNWFASLADQYPEIKTKMAQW